MRDESRELFWLDLMGPGVIMGGPMQLCVCVCVCVCQLGNVKQFCQGKWVYGRACVCACVYMRMRIRVLL